ncbi:MAG TPA: hypothetical protein VGO47_12905 [Chlamydiales bacterium]|nr:hypothetical protein [Chlamydiales bacterium]
MFENVAIFVMNHRLCVCDECRKQTVQHVKSGLLVSGQYLNKRQWADHQEVQREADAIAQIRNVAATTALRTMDVMANENDVGHEVVEEIS